MVEHLPGMLMALECDFPALQKNKIKSQRGKSVISFTPPNHHMEAGKSSGWGACADLVPDLRELSVIGKKASV